LSASVPARRKRANGSVAGAVISDLCADTDEEVHRVLVTKVFPRQARVVTSDEWCSASVD
jgi:hypothetical protein